MGRAGAAPADFDVWPDSPFIRAREALQANDADAALTILRPYDGPARDYADHLRALAWWRLGDRPIAEMLWARAEHETKCRSAGPSVLEERVRVDRAALLAPIDAAAAADQLLALPPDPERWTRALWYLSVAELAARADALTIRLLTEFPASPEAVRLAAQLTPPGVVARLETVERRLVRLRALLDAHANETAAEEAAALIAVMAEDDPRRCEVLYIQGKTARKRRQYREAIPLLTKAREICPTDGAGDFAVRSALLETQVQSILGDLDDIQAVVDWMVEHHPKHRYTDDALFLLAEVLERSGRETAARRRFEQVAEIDGADYAPIAEWRLAWANLRRDRFTRARPRLERILNRNDTPRDDRDRALYWLARVDERRRREAAVDRYERLAHRPSFYGWMALDRLRSVRPSAARSVEARLKAAVSSTTALEVADAIRARPAFADAVAFAQAGETALASWSVRRLTCTATNAEAILAVALALDRLGASAEAQLQLRRHPELLAGPLTKATVDRWRAAYSRPFREELSAAADAAGVDELLLTALTREESTFEPEIVSWAGATGLAQLMPATAKGAYAQVHGGELDLARLTEPGLNVRLGAHVLKQGIVAFGHPVLAMGAYNGGPGLVRSTLDRRPEPFERWIEDFGVQETRRYMKRVTESWGIYRLLYDSKKPFISLPKTVARRR